MGVSGATRGPVRRAHQVPDLEEPPAEGAPRMERGEVFLLKAPPLRDRKGEGISHGEHRRRRGGRSQVQRTGLARNREGDRDLAARPAEDAGSPVMTIVRIFRDRANSSRRTTSGVSPEVESARTTSPGISMPRFPWLASPACRK